MARGGWERGVVEAGGWGVGNHRVTDKTTHGCEKTRGLLSLLLRLPEMQLAVAFLIAFNIIISKSCNKKLPITAAMRQQGLY